MKASVLIPLALVLCVTAGVNAATGPWVDAGTVQASPNTTKTFAINVSGGGFTVQGVDLYIQIGDGGSVNGGTDATPTITAIDLVGTGTIFNGNNTGQNTTDYGLIWSATTTTNSGEIEPTGVLAYVTIDTTGTTAGESYGLLLSGVANNAINAPNGVDTAFSGGNTSYTYVTNGTIEIVPEPASMALLALGGLAVLRRRRRR